MTIWPLQRDCSEFYGDPDRNDDGTPDRRWEDANIVRIDAPWQMVLAWDTSKTVRKIPIHKKCADAFVRVFAAIKTALPTETEIRQARLHLYGGAYNFRTMRGSNQLSMHSYGCAIDLDPEGNPLGRPWGPGMIDPRVVGAFKNEGAVWGGGWKRRPDCQHFQFARVVG
jgi:hypothetical protein